MTHPRRRPAAAKTAGHPRLTWPQVCARRLERHALAAPRLEASPAGIARAMVGAHAQVMTAAELSIGLRLPGATRQGIQDALWVERSLVKTFGPRGTVHLLPAADLALWTGALAALPARRSGLPEAARLTPVQTEAVLAAIDAALSGAELTTDELTDAVVAATGPWAADPVMPAFNTWWPRWRQAIGLAATRGLLCFGPNRGRNVTYTSPRRWLPGFQPADGQAALAWLVGQYLHSYGPAAPQHFAQWLAAPKSWAAALFNSLGDALEPVDMDGMAAFVMAGDTAASGEPPRGVRLLPYFDPFVIGGHPREWLFPGVAAGRALGRGQAGVHAVLLVNGVVAGVWHQKRQGGKLEITVEPFKKLTTPQRRELDEQAGRVGEFVEAAPELAVGQVRTRGHL